MQLAYYLVTLTFGSKLNHRPYIWQGNFFAH